MAIAPHHLTVQDEYGNAVVGAQIEVRKESDNSLASLFSDIAGATPISNPTNTGSNGAKTFYVEAGYHKITVTLGSASEVRRNVPIIAA